MRISILTLLAVVLAACPLFAATKPAATLDWTMPEVPSAKVVPVKLDWSLEETPKPAPATVPMLDWMTPTATPARLDWAAEHVPDATKMIPGMTLVPTIPPDAPLIQGRCTGPECQQQLQQSAGRWYLGKNLGR